MRIRVDASGVETLVDRLEDQTRSNGPLHDVIKKVSAPFVAEPFIRSRTPDGRPWAPLAASTVRGRIRRGFPAGPPLIRSGQLFRSMQRVVSEGDSVVFGPSTEYGEFLNDGTNRMPARAFVPRDRLPVRWESAIDEGVEAEIEKIR